MHTNWHEEAGQDATYNEPILPVSGGGDAAVASVGDDILSERSA